MDIGQLLVNNAFTKMSLAILSIKRITKSLNFGILESLLLCFVPKSSLHHPYISP